MDLRAAKNDEILEGRVDWPKYFFVVRGLGKSGVLDWMVVGHGRVKIFFGVKDVVGHIFDGVTCSIW